MEEPGERKPECDRHPHGLLPRQPIQAIGHECQQRNPAKGNHAVIPYQGSQEEAAGSAKYQTAVCAYGSDIPGRGSGDGLFARRTMSAGDEGEDSGIEGHWVRSRRRLKTKD